MRDEHSHPSDSSQCRLAVRLKAEALAERPAFSETFHARIMGAIEAPSDPGTPTTVAVRPRRSAASLIAIAAGLLIAALGIMQLGGSGSIPVPSNLPFNVPSGVAVTRPTGDTISLDDLDHGAVAAVRLVVDQLPIEVPTVDWGSALVD
jgi:hypothetical protein